jgi:outer membrane protein OmpA-like peptidoglycan-associated protein
VSLTRIGCAKLGLVLLTLTACYRPPYNQFEPPQTVATHTAVGAGVGAVAGAAAGATVLGTGIGAASGAFVGVLKTNKTYLAHEMKRYAIQLVEYGDTITIIVPIDRYYQFNRAQLHELQYTGLEAMLDFIRLYPKAKLTVAAFTDNVGSEVDNVRFSDARAHTMVTFLYANGFSAKQLRPEAYGPVFAVGDNHLIHGSAYNRRIEIQWHKSDCPALESARMAGMTK